MVHIPKTREELSSMSSEELCEYIAGFSTGSFVSPLIDVLYELAIRLKEHEENLMGFYIFRKPNDPTSVNISDTEG